MSEMNKEPTQPDDGELSGLDELDDEPTEASVVPSQPPPTATGTKQNLKERMGDLQQRIDAQLHHPLTVRPLRLESEVGTSSMQRPAEPSVPSVIGAVNDPRYIVVTDESKTGVELLDMCIRAAPGHESCKPILLGDLEPAFRLTNATVDGTQLANLRVPSVMQLLFVKYALEQGFKTHREQFLQSLLMDSPTQAMSLFYSYRAMRKSSTLPTAKQLKAAYELKVQSCNVARGTLHDDKFRAICFSTRCCELYKDKSDEHMLWKNLFQDSATHLELIRIDEVHRGKRRITSSTVLIGDGLLEELETRINHGHHFSIHKRRTDELVTALDNSFFLGSSVKKVVVMMGRDDINAGCSMEEITNAHHRVASRLMQYKHIEVFWVHPPYVHARSETWKKFVRHYDRCIHDVTKNEPYPKHIMCSGYKEFNLGQIFLCGRQNFAEAIDTMGRPTLLGHKLLVSYLHDVWSIPLSLRRSCDAPRNFPPQPVREQKRRGQGDDDRRSEKRRRAGL